MSNFNERLRFECYVWPVVGRGNRQEHSGSRRMTREREKSTKELREKRFNQTHQSATELIEAEARAKREKSERLRLARISAENSDPHEKPQ